MKKFSIFIFDLDGVIFDSKKNMKISWEKTNNKFDLNIKFSKYFNNIGIPFKEILRSLNIKKNLNQIEKEYRNNSKKFMNKVDLFKGIRKFLYFLDKKNIPYSIVTSKDYERSKILLKKYNIYAKSVHSPSKKYKNKLDMIKYCLKKNKFKKKNCCYVGDTRHDYIAATKSKISFIYANYGYGEKDKKYKLVINSPYQLNKYI